MVSTRLTHGNTLPCANGTGEQSLNNEYPSHIQGVQSLYYV